jgi:2-desacetyl-2-hydroxyethyl bacteriochlorophyllide A dehydrogenase
LKAVVVERGAPTVVDRDDPEAPEGEARIRVLLAGICGTDLEIARGYMGFDGVLGHEFVGVVESASERGWIGTRVVGEINVPCGRCETCASGMRRHCPARGVLGISGRDGAFAERLVLPLSNLHAVPDGVSDEAAVFTEPLAAAHEILDQIPVPSGSRTLVLGDGRLGQLCAQVLAKAGAPPVVAGRHRSKLHRLERRGLRTTADTATLAREFDIVIEATGSPDGLRRALELVRPRGTIVLKSTYRGNAALELASVVIDEITIVGSRCGSFEPALSHLASDLALHDGMVTARYPLVEAAAAFARAADPGTLKVLLAP